MNKNKIGTIFFVSILALAGIGISYAGFIDVITVYGNVDTATVDLVVEDYSGTDVWKVYGPDAPDGEIVIWRGFISDQDRPTKESLEEKYSECTAILVASSWASEGTNYDVDMVWDNIFPCIDFTADVIIHYAGTIPAHVDVTDLVWDLTGENYDFSKYTTFEVYQYTLVNNEWLKGNLIPSFPIQMHFCEYIGIEVTIHIAQDNSLQDKHGEFSFDINAIQWNDECDQQPTTISRTYTLDADFDEGILTNVNYVTVHDQLQLDETIVPLPFIWVPNSNEGTVSKYDTSTGKELARYWTGPNTGGDPSRTTVDQEGSCWFGNRATGTVIKIGLYEAGNWIDKNGNGICDTSTDANNDGDVYGSEILPWNTDECVLFVVNIGGGPRGFAVDSNNDLWVGTYTLADGNKFFHIDGDTGTVIAADTINLFGTGYSYASYGAVIDENGFLWSSCGPSAPYILKIDTATKVITPVFLSLYPYGIAIDGNGHLFVASWGNGLIGKVDINTLAVTTANQYCSYARGVACTDDGDVWVVDTYGTEIERFDNNLVHKATIDIGPSGGSHYSTGVAVDKDGNVWACNFYDGNILRIDTTTDTVDITKHTVGYTGAGSGQHYSYSDMTGKIAIGTTTKLGYWTVTWDTGYTNVQFDTISWTSSEPAGTAITVQVRSSTDNINWGGWTPVTNPGDPGLTGRYLQIEVKFQIFSGETSPILYDLSVGATIL